MINLFTITGKRILITGSGGGIGLCLAEGLSQNGASVILNGRNFEKLESARRFIGDKGYIASISVFDITDEKRVIEAIDKIEMEDGPIDILINNAGIQKRAPLEEFSSSDWDELININLKGAFLTGRTVARKMIDRKRGKIINICSLQSELARPSIAPYAASKGGLKMLTRAMATEWAKYNIQVNGIGPGYFKTEITKALYENKEFDTWLCNRTPAHRWGNTDELIGAVVFLSSEASSFINGQIIYVDGGIMACI
jgi:gluconate 5-dehydrogenase